MSKIILCEACGKTGLSSKMAPLQLNMHEALLVCENSECLFPLGTERSQSFVISRKVEELSKTKRHKYNAFEKMPSNYQNKDQVIHWENLDALCWLDSALSLIVYNTSIKQLVSKTQNNEDSLLKYLVEQFEKAQYLAEFDQINAKKILEDVRRLVWTFLSPKMKCTLGVNDSPLFALPLLLRETDSTAKKCVQEYQCEFRCEECGHTQSTSHKKYVVTLPNTPEDFDVQQASFHKTCNSCGAQDQCCRIVHQSVPDVLLFHFVEGLKSSNYLDYTFHHNGHSYHFSQFIQYKQDPDHFICWTKNDKGSKWLELDDLKPSIHHWSTIAPNVPPSQVHIIVLQKMQSPLKQELNEANTSQLNNQTTKQKQLTSLELCDKNAINLDDNTKLPDVTMSRDGDLKCSPNQEKSTFGLIDTSSRHEELTCSDDMETSGADVQNTVCKPKTLSSVLEHANSNLNGHEYLVNTDEDNLSTCTVEVDTVQSSTPKDTDTNIYKYLNVTDNVNVDACKVEVETVPSLSTPNDTNSYLNDHKCLNDMDIDTCTLDIEAEPSAQENNSLNIEVQDVLRELELKLSINSNSDTTKSCIDCNSNRMPLKNLNTPNASRQNLSLTATKKCLDRKPFCTTPHSAGSLFRVAVKRFSSSNDFHPLFPKRRRTLLPNQFQPYVPKKERTCSPLPLTTNKICATSTASDDVKSPTSPCSFLDGNSDSGYSSPSSVSSSLSSTSTLSKEESIADQLEKLLPDCLGDCVPNIKDISTSQDDFIQQLLFAD